MHRIDTSTREKDLFGPGKDGFTGGNPLAAKPPTDLSADWFNDVQENIAGAIEGAGIELAKGDGGQLLRAIANLSLAHAPWIQLGDTRARNVAFAASMFVAVDPYALTVPQRIRTSPDGIAWTGGSGSVFLDDRPYAAAWGGGRWVAVGSETTELEFQAVWRSDDGLTWTRNVLEEGVLLGVVYGAGLFVAVGSLRKIQTSPNGIVWTERTPDAGFSGDFRGVTYGAGLFVAVGASGEIQTSPDGIVWTQRGPDAGFSGDFRGVTYGAGLFVAVGASGEIQTSPDGIVWTKRTPDAGFSGDFSGVAYGAGLFVVVGASGEIQTSRNAETWTKVLAPDIDASCVVYGPDRFVAMGNGGTHASARFL